MERWVDLGIAPSPGLRGIHAVLLVEESLQVLAVHPGRTSPAPPWRV
ncbi:hypothetical protein AB0M50_39790 [Nonomuraea fuscirosea]|nr:hypothetical protein [Nonomuraea fuscirosea]WSA53643.1 hypothetical protein OIE67_03110 [Nonomuraea fuscirosea]